MTDKTVVVPVEQARETLWREWGIDGMPKDKQRLADAAFKAGLAATPKQQAVDKETLVAFERVFWKAVELSGSRDFDHDVCKEVRDFRSLLAALPGKTEVE